MVRDQSTNTTSAATDCLGKNITIDDIKHTVSLLKRFDRPTIYIWNGKKIGESRGFRYLLPLPEKPQIKPSSYLLDEDVFYIVAGIGIVACEKMCKRIETFNLNLMWSDSPMDLDEQTLLFESLGLAQRKIND